MLISQREVHRFGWLLEHGSAQARHRLRTPVAVARTAGGKATRRRNHAHDSLEALHDPPVKDNHKGALWSAPL